VRSPWPLVLLGIVVGCGSRTDLPGGSSPSAGGFDQGVPSAPACTTSAPTPTELYATSLGSGASLALDDTRVYWVESSQGLAIKSLSKCGGTPVTLGGASSGAARVIPRDDFAYWMQGGQDLVRTPAGGGAPQAVRSFDFSVGDFALDAANVYALGYEIGAAGIWTAPFGGAGPVELAAVSPSWMPSLAVDENNIYFSTEGQPYYNQLARVPRTGGAPQQLTNLSFNSTGPWMVAGNIVLDDGYAYWPASQGGILRVAKDGSETLMLTRASGRATIAADATYVYIAAGGGPVSRVPKTGGSQQVLATPLEPFEIAVDVRSVYWLERASDGFRLMKLDLPGQ
jgi:hypothetical protein